MSLHIKPKLSTKLLGSDFSKGSPFGSSRSSFGNAEGFSGHLNFRCILITFCLAAIIYEVCWVISFLVGWISASDQYMTMDSFASSGRSGIKKDLTNITWDHAVNSKARLSKSLKGTAQMLEADVLMGISTSEIVKFDSDEEPIMAHPPTSRSDLSFSDFLSAVIKHNNKDDRPKMGIKLDFKEIDCVEPVLKKLRDKKKSINFPVWLNADVLPGPVNATKVPVDGNQFLGLIKKYLPEIPHATLSLGWATRYGNDDEKQGSSSRSGQKITSGQYTNGQINEMVKLWDDSQLTDATVTFPVRAAIALQSEDALVNLLNRIGSKSSLTLWSPEDDLVNVTKIQNLIENVGRDKVYCDLPFSLATDTDNDNESIQVFPDTTTVHPTLPDKHPRTNNDTHPDNGKNEGSAPKGIHHGLTLLSLVTFFFAYFL